MFSGFTSTMFDSYIGEWFLSWKGVALLSIVLFYIFRVEISHRYFVYFMIGFEKAYNLMCDDIKATFFEPLHKMVPSDPELRKKKPIRILEIGVGTGANLRHLPSNVQYSVLDINRHMEKVFNANKSINPNLDYQKFIAGSAEEMTDIPDESYDVVIATLLLCSCDVAKVVKESYRILAPGGKFYFMEHIISKDRKNRFMQYFMTYSRIWPFLADGCQLTRDPLPQIKKVFDYVDSEYFELPYNPKIAFLMKMGVNLLSAHVKGIATKA